MTTQPRDPNRVRFGPASLWAAKNSILTPQESADTRKRWSMETPATFRILDPLIPGGATVLDYGSGVGRIIRALGAKRSDLRFLYVDAAPEMAKKARKHLGPRIARRTRFILFKDPDSFRRAVRANSVDFIISIFVLQHVYKPWVTDLIDSFYRILAPGGKLFLLNMHHRAVPVLSPLEAAARPGKMRDRAVIQAVSRSNPVKAWTDDGLEIRALVRRRFGNEMSLPFPPKGFPENTPREHFIAIYEKGPPQAW